MLRLITAFSILLVLCLSSSTAMAVTYVVKPDSTGDFPAIWDAVSWVNTYPTGADTILLTDGTFTGGGNREIDYMGMAITIRSQSGNPKACIIDCGGSPSMPCRGFWFTSSEGPGSVLEGVTVTNGWADTTMGYDPKGGGAIVVGSSPTFINCIFSHNTARDDGGGIFHNGGSPSLEDCMFSHNVTIDGHGGGMTTMGTGAPSFTGCIFSRNSADRTYGGGLSAFWFDGQLEYCTFDSNSAGLLGGGGGGGFYCGNNSTPVLTNCTFLGNRAVPLGGGLWVDWNSSAILDNTIIAFSIQGEAAYCTNNCFASATCCDVYGNAGGDYVSCLAGQLGLRGNISLDPLFCMAQSPDPYTLNFASPCAPFSPPNDTCDLIGAWPVGCDGVPVVLTSLQAIGAPACITLEWVTASEVNCHRWEIHRAEREDGEFTKVGELPGHGSTETAHTYRWVDQDVLPDVTYYYKLQQIDLDGSATWSSVVSATPSPARPTDFVLRQNYPNPFNPATEISYAVPQDVHVTVKIYNIQGGEVATLVDADQQAGFYMVSWNAEGLASGVYFCRLQAGEFEKTIKMAFVR